MKKIIFCIFIIFFTILSCLYAQITISAARQGLMTWFEQILPTLLPFSILSSVLIKSHLIPSLAGNKSNLLSITITIICGLIFGFPIGAKLASDFYGEHLISKKQGILLSVFTNNFSYMYVCNYVYPTLFYSSNLSFSTIFLLYVFPTLAGICALILSNDYKQEEADKKTASRFHLDMQIIDAGIISGFESLIKICGYIILSSVITQLLCLFIQNDSLPGLLFLGNMEITGGIQLLSQNYVTNPKDKYLFAIQFLTFGGLSGIAQTASILNTHKLNIRYYIIGKLLLSFTTVLIAFIIIGKY